MRIGEMGKGRKGEGERGEIFVLKGICGEI